MLKVSVLGMQPHHTNNLGVTLKVLDVVISNGA